MRCGAAGEVCGAASEVCVLLVRCVVNEGAIAAILFSLI